MTKSRKQELDILRIFACLLVISSHLLYLFALDVNFAQWGMANIYYVARNACVPLFFSLSGILLLRNDEFSAGDIIKKIFFYVIIYVIGCTFYNLWGIDNLPITLKKILDYVIPGMKNPMLLWYLAELCGIYAFVPILARIVRDEKLCKYYLSVWVIYNFALRNISLWLAYLENDKIRDAASVFALFYAKEFLTYSGYLVMGYYLYHYFNKHVKGWILLGVLLASIAVPAFFNQIIVTLKGQIVNSVYDYTGFSALLQTGCYVLIAKQYLSKLKMNERCRMILMEASACTFGIYLLHPMFTGTLMWKLPANILLRTPVITIFIFVVCCIIVAAVRRGGGTLQKKWCVCSWKKRKFLISLCIVWLGVFMITLYNCGLYGDGSFICLYLLDGGKLGFADMDPFALSRGGVRALIEIFTYVCIRIGITDIPFITHVYTFGCIFWVGLFLTASLYICYRYHSSEKILNHTMILSSLTLGFGGLYCTHESFTAIAIIWFIFICIYSWDSISQKTGWTTFLIVTLLFCLSGTYESFGVIGPVILVYYFVKRIKGQEKFFDRRSLIVISLILLNSAYEIYWIMHPGAPELRAGIVSSFFQQDWRLLILLVCLALFLLGVEMVPKVKDAKIIIFFEAMLSLLWIVYIVCDPLRIASDCRSTRNLFSLLIPFLFVLYEILQLLVQKRYEYPSKILTVALSGACLIAVFGFSSGYSNYLKHLHNMASSAYGFVTWDSSDEDTAYNTDWPVPNESVFASMLYSNDDTIHGIVVQKPEEIYFQQYDMWNIHAYYDLSRYGINYDIEAFESILYRDEAEGELLRVCFTDGTNSAMKYIAEGISHSESGFTWTDGDCLKLKPVQINPYSREHSYMLTLKIGGTYQGQQEIVVSCSDEEVFRSYVPEEGGTIAIPVQADEQGLIDIRVDLPDAVSPKEIEQLDDSRKLALMLLEMSLAAE